MANIQVQQDNPVAKLKRVLNVDSVQQQFKNALKDGTALFVASLIDLYANDKYLQQCDPNAVIMEALKAATLKLPINKSLGFAYIVPYKNNKEKSYIPTMIVGYKGYLQMAQRTAQYKYINADCVFEGEKIDQDRLTGEIYISGEPSSENAIGYFAHIETLNGFRKTIFWSKAKVTDHAKRYSQSYASDYSPWKKQFDTMAIKTVLRHLLSRYGIMSVDMAQAVDMDAGDYKESEPETVSRPSISYEATGKPPVEKSKVVDFKVQSAPPATLPPEQGQAVDQFGTALDSPFEKSKWFHQRAGSPNDGTGFAAYVASNLASLGDASPAALKLMRDKFEKLYGKPWPYGRDPQEAPASDPDKQSNADPQSSQQDDAPWYTDEEMWSGLPSEQGGQDTSGESPAPEVPILETDAAKVLAGLAGKHKREYIMVVKGRNPESVEQIYDWIDQINALVVEHSKGAQDTEKF